MCVCVCVCVCYKKEWNKERLVTLLTSEHLHRRLNSLWDFYSFISYCLAEVEESLDKSEGKTFGNPIFAKNIPYEDINK